MLNYILKRLFLIIPTLFGVVIVNFAIIQAAPGGPVEQAISRMKGLDGNFTDRFTSGGKDFVDTKTGSQTNFTGGGNSSSQYRGAQGIDPEIIKKIEKIYGFDRPVTERFWTMLKSFLSFNFEKSFYRDKNVLELIFNKLPVSISLGLWTTLLTYLISIPLGIKKAVSDGSRFDVTSSFIIIIGYAIPSFLFAVFLIVLFAGGSFWQIFPLRGLTSDNFEFLPWYKQILDYLWHITLPVIAMVIGGFASLTILCKNSFLEEISKQYVLTARAKGCGEKRVLYGHIFRNAMLIVIAGFPSAFVGILFTGSFLIEIIFSLDGLGLLSFEATVSRDYPVIFGSLFIFTLLGLVMNLIGDLVYILVDPRIDFEKVKMFTGIITDIAEVLDIKSSPTNTKLILKTSFDTEKILLGASIACNGCCLTVIEKQPNILHFDLSPETIKRTNFANIKIGSKINLEQSLKIGDELGGHLVTGHVDALIKVTHIIKNSENWVVEFRLPSEYKKYVAEKGSATINGVSLTVNYVENDLFKINIIPHTLEKTNLSEMKVGDNFNFEVDIIARYIN